MVLITDYIAGITGGVAVVLVGHPFDTTKTRLQTAPVGHYKGTLDCVKTTFKNEGFKGFYAGLASPLYGQMFFRSASFATFFHVTSYFQAQHVHTSISQLELTLAGAATGFMISFIEAPIDLIKTKMQIQIFNVPSKSTTSVHPPVYSSMMGCIRYTVKTHGFKSLFQGLSATFMRNVPANALFFPINELVKGKCAEWEGVSIDNISLMSRFVSGACAGLGYWVTTYPLDVLKATSQSFEYPNRLPYMQTVRHVYTNGGEKQSFRNFFRGFAPCAIRAIPACACMFTTVDLVRNFLKNDQSR